MVREFTKYLPLRDALDVLEESANPLMKRELVPVGDSFGRVLFDDVISRVDMPPADSSHMDGFALRSADVVAASEGNPVSLKRVRGTPLGVIPRSRVGRGEAQAVLTGGYMPAGADAVVQSESVMVTENEVLVRKPVKTGEFVFARGRDMKRGELVLKKGRTMRGADAVLLASLHMDKVAVYRRPRVAIVPTGDELSTKIRGTEPGKVVETHSMLLTRLIDGAGGYPLPMPIARDNSKEITASIKRALRMADLVLTLAGSSVGEPDLTEKAIADAGEPGVLVHGMRVFRGRVMGFGAVRGKGVVILPGPVQGAVNAFALMAYPIIRSFLGRGFEEPPSLPARMGLDWEAGDRYRDFTKIVYAKIGARGDELIVEPSAGETEKITHLVRNDGYIVVDEDRVKLGRGDLVRVHLLPGLSPLSFTTDD